eukprot:10809_4
MPSSVVASVSNAWFRMKTAGVTGALIMSIRIACNSSLALVKISTISSLFPPPSRGLSTYSDGFSTARRFASYACSVPSPAHTAPNRSARAQLP